MKWDNHYRAKNAQILSWNSAPCSWMIWRNGREVMNRHVLEGYTGPSGGYMPPKGGRLDLSDDEVKLAVDYILAQTE